MTTKQKPPLRLRHELKFNINHADAMQLSATLSKLFQRDAHADSHGVYRVSSCYFDTPYDRALRQKLDGVNRREKFRLRYYGEDASFVKLEKKFKINGLCGKHSATLTKQQAQMLLDGDIDFLLASEHPLLLELYSKMKGQLLRPATVVTYLREAYVYAPGNVRITIDRDLRRGAWQCSSFLNPAMLHAPVSEGLSVLEVKYDNFLPQIAAMAVQTRHRRLTAYSKYAACRRFD